MALVTAANSILLMHKHLLTQKINRKPLGLQQWSNISMSLLEVNQFNCYVCDRNLPPYSGKHIVRGDFLIFSSNKSFLLRNKIMEVSVNHLLLQMESKSFKLSCIRFWNKENSYHRTELQCYNWVTEVILYIFFSYYKGKKQSYETTMLCVSLILSTFKPADKSSLSLVWMFIESHPHVIHINFLQ
jgi:hypothetical protein